MSSQNQVSCSRASVASARQCDRQASPLWSSPSCVGLIGDLDAPVRVGSAEVLLDDAAVVSGDIVRLGQGGEILAEVREEHADAFVLERRRGRERVLDGLAWHEPTHRALARTAGGAASRAAAGRGPSRGAASASGA